MSTWCVSWTLVVLTVVLSGCGPSVPLPDAEARTKRIVDSTVETAAPGAPVEAGGRDGEPFDPESCGFGVLVGMGERSDYRLLFTMGEPSDGDAVMDAVAEFWVAQGFEIQSRGSRNVRARDGDFSYSAALLDPDVGRGRITGTTPCYY